MLILSRFGRTMLRRMKRDQRGSASVEFVIWLPLFMIIVGIVVDVTTLMTTQARFYDVARDASRQVALGIKSESDAQTQASQTLGSNPNITVAFVPDSTFSTVRISAPFSEFVIFGDVFVGTTPLVAEISMVKESAVSAGS